MARLLGTVVVALLVGTVVAGVPAPAAAGLAEPAIPAYPLPPQVDAAPWLAALLRDPVEATRTAAARGLPAGLDTSGLGPLLASVMDEPPAAAPPGGDLAAAVLAAYAARGLAVDAALAAEVGARFAPVPAALAEPLAAVLEAASDLARLAGTPPARAEVARAREAAAQDLAARAAADEPDAAAAAALEELLGGPPRPVPDAAPPRAAALRLAAAVDRAHLALAATPLRLTEAVSDPLGLVVLGTDAPETYDARFRILVVEPGGDDTYLGPVGAGFCPALCSADPLAGPAGVLLDLGGNDLYQGVAGFGHGGVGIAVDQAGDDRHLSTSGGGLSQATLCAACDPPATSGTPLPGIGLFRDLAGADTYVVGGGTALGLCTGHACTEALGLWLDDAGADTLTGFLVPTGLSPGSFGTARVTASSNGVGSGLARGVALNLGDDADAYFGASMGAGRAAGSFVQASLRAEGLFVEGGGADTYQAFCVGFGCVSAGRGSGTTSGSGASTAASASAVGVGVFLELAGDDVVLDSSCEGSASASAGFLSPGAGLLGVGLFLEAAGREAKRGSCFGTATAGAASGAGGQAYALFADLAGHDEYNATSSVMAGFAQAQAFAGAAVGATGVFLDLAGNDRYNTTLGLGSATANALGPGPAPGVPPASAGAHGFFLDLAGDDTYLAKSIGLFGAQRMLGAANTTDLLGTGTGAGVGAVGTFVDAAGNDRYPLCTLCRGWARTSSSAALFLDLGGADTYAGTPGADGATWSQTPTGLGADSDASRAELHTAPLGTGLTAPQGVPAQSVATPPVGSTGAATPAVPVPRTCVPTEVACVDGFTVPSQTLGPTPAVPSQTVATPSVPVPSQACAAAPGACAPVSVTVGASGFDTLVQHHAGEIGQLGPYTVTVPLPVVGPVGLTLCGATCTGPVPPAVAAQGEATVIVGAAGASHRVTVPVGLGT